MTILATLAISDDSGFLAIVNADEYKSFVDSQWELPQLLNHFVDEMNKDNLIIWATGCENDWTVMFLDKPSEEVASREFSKTIRVTNRKLFLTNYEDLTIAAQFQEEKIPQRHNAQLCIDLANGNYNFTVRQLFIPEERGYVAEGSVGFEVVIRAVADKPSPKIGKVFWWTK